MPNTPARKESTSYSPEEVDRIRESIATPGAKVVCPQCQDEFTQASVIAGGGTVAMVFELLCESCGRSLLISDLRLHRDP